MACVGGSVAVSGTLSAAPLMTTQAVRYALAVGLLLGIARLTGRRVSMPRGVEWLWLVGVAVAGLVLFNVALVRGAEHAEPAVLGVAIAGVPLVLALAGGRPRRAVVLGAVLVTAGAALVEGGGHADLVGLGWAALVLACEVGFTLLAVPVLGRLGPWGVAVHSCWIAVVLLAAIGWATEGPAAVLTLTPAHLLAVGYLAVVVTAVAFVLWYGAVTALGPARAGLLTGVVPVAAAGLGAVVGGPVPGPLVWAGIALVGAGLALGVSGGAARRPAGAAAGGPATAAAGSALGGSAGPVRRGASVAGAAAGDPMPATAAVGGAVSAVGVSGAAR
jgi:drug/metabolite transporter (DMT)-like permease